jgi:transcription antitermination factor NusG
MAAMAIRGLRAPLVEANNDPLRRSRRRVEKRKEGPMLRNEETTSFYGSAYACWWHALYTRHQHEKVVAQALSGKGFEVFLPQYRTVRKWKDRQKEIALPLFPNYVFIHGGLDRMLSIVTTPGVHSLVSWGGRPAEIPWKEIEAVRRLVESSLPIEPHPFLKCGDVVRIKSGALEGIEGILVRKTRRVRLVLSVEMLSRSAAVEVDVNVVERVDAAAAHRTEMQRTAPGVSYGVAYRPCVLGAE